MSMLGSPNLHRDNVPLAMRLKIHDLHDLHAQLVPLDRYGLGDMSFAITRTLPAHGCAQRAAWRVFLRPRQWPQCRGRVTAPDFGLLSLKPRAVVLPVALERSIR
jgi:hypothetical protein